MVMQFLWLYIDDIIGKGISLWVILELLLYSACAVVPFSLPLATLLSAIMTMSNFSEHNELLAMKASGISLPRILRPLIFFSTGLVLFTFLFSNYVVPHINLKFFTLLYDIKKARPEMQIREGVFEDTAIEGIKMYVGQIDRATGMLHHVKIYNYTENRGNVSVIVADSAKIRLSKNNKYLIFSFYQGSSYDDMEDKNPKRYPFQKKHFAEHDIVFEMPEEFTRSAGDMLQNSYKMLPMRELQLFTDSLRREEIFKLEEVLHSYFYASNFQRSMEFQEIDRFVYPLNIDSIYQHISVPEQYDVATTALRYAKEGRGRLMELSMGMRYISRSINLYRIEWHRKWVYSVACLIFFFVGGPLGTIIRKGGLGTPFILSLLIFLFYYVISISFEKMAKDGLLQVPIAMWISTFITTFLAVVLYYKSAKEISFAIPYRHQQKIRKWVVEKLKRIHVHVDTIDYYSDCISAISVSKEMDIITELKKIVEFNNIWQYQHSKLLKSTIQDYVLAGVPKEHLSSKKTFAAYYISFYQNLLATLLLRHHNDEILMNEIKQLPIINHRLLLFKIPRSTLHLKTILYLLIQQRIAEQ